MTRKWDPNGVFDVLADPHVRRILVETRAKRRSVKDLSRICDGSESSIYRRVGVMATHGLLREETKVDREGHHYSVYEPNFETIEVRLNANQLLVTLRQADGSSSTFAEGPESIGGEL
ncbi:winged helix-turn-helix domain-containing protein [Halegenticoccus soli]|uniref:winged helix-turn-helix domain-containing protein n=1 Tax=Halegenticoccus soli TaxID=1985678 RepID=UPI000C6D85F6|nr:helix-turn-helix domain-containing protein [Halegenticoccus soli]